MKRKVNNSFRHFEQRKGLFFIGQCTNTSLKVLKYRK